MLELSSNKPRPRHLESLIFVASRLPDKLATNCQRDNSMEKIGFIGIGLMGLPMCQRLLAAHCDLTVYNRTPSKTQALQEQGAKAVDSIESLVSSVDIIMLCVSDTLAVESVMAEALPYLKPKQIIVDFSSISPAATRQLATSVEAKQCAWIDSPVSGGVAGAEAGSLAIMVGGDTHILKTIEPILQNLGQRITHMGPNGAGQTSKICNQMLVSCNVLVMAEVMALAKKSGVDAARLPEALKGGFADSLPLQLTGPRMAEQDFDEVKWKVKTLLKDLDMANTLAHDMTSSVPMAGLGAELMRQHAARGFAEQDPSTLVMLYEALLEK
ncbi:NAD(P)-dependent oxidoreductase [Bermanella marisrubri]|uniref:NAD(P)-dependent oxidoreductase n=1 Tax=Bermanella marisrubri TaxID=207949 RepID=UPI00243666C8|nr:NAD(P)-dependent oxidoreductase [Bermanella marisrubri]